MKLYTEEQIAKAVMFGRWGGTMKKDYEDFLNKLTPIELPSDEEIHKQATNYSSLYYEFRAGAQWVIEQLKNQQK